MNNIIKILTFSIIFLSLLFPQTSCKPTMKECSVCSSIPAAEAPAYLVSHPEVILLDVRTDEEVADGRVEGSIHIDVKSPDFAAQVIQLDTSKTYMVHCRSGIRSTKAINIMIENGFENLINVEGGYNEWPQ